MAFFDPEGKFAKYGGKLWDMMWLNILCILSSLPIITIGAAQTALHYVMLKIVRDEETAITKAYFHSFWMNLRQAIVLELIFAVILYLMAVSFRLITGMQTFSGRILFVIAAIFSAVLAGTSLWSGVVLSRYQGTVFQTIKLGWLMCMGHPIRTILMIFIEVIPIVCVLLQPALVFPMVVLGFTLPGLGLALLYHPVFLKLEEEKGAASENKDQLESADAVSM